MYAEDWHGKQQWWKSSRFFTESRHWLGDEVHDSGHFAFYSTWMGQIRNGPSSLGCRKSRITGIYRLIFEPLLRLQCHGHFLSELTQIIPFPIYLVIFISSKRKASVCCCKWPCVYVSIFEVHSVCKVFWSG